MDDKKAINRLVEDVAYAVSKDANVADNYLKEKGVDTEKLTSDGLALIRKMKLLRQSAINEEKEKTLEEMAWKKILETAKEKAISEVAALNLLIPNLRQSSALYSKLETLSQDDLKKVLEEEGLLKLMEQMDQKKDDK